jgi:hypothetical protein
LKRVEVAKLRLPPRLECPAFGAAPGSNKTHSMAGFSVPSAQLKDFLFQYRILKVLGIACKSTA